MAISMHWLFYVSLRLSPCTMLHIVADSVCVLNVLRWLLLQV